MSFHWKLVLAEAGSGIQCLIKRPHTGFLRKQEWQKSAKCVRFNLLSCSSFLIGRFGNFFPVLCLFLLSVSPFWRFSARGGRQKKTTRRLSRHLPPHLDHRTLGSRCKGLQKTQLIVKTVIPRYVSGTLCHTNSLGAHSQADGLFSCPTHSLQLDSAWKGKNSN